MFLFAMIGMVLMAIPFCCTEQSGDHQRHRNKHEESPGLRTSGAYIVPFWTSGFT